MEKQLIVTDIPAQIHQDYKALCALWGVHMRIATIELLREVCKPGSKLISKRLLEQIQSHNKEQRQRINKNISHGNQQRKDK